MEKPTEYSLTWEVTDEMTAKRIGSAGSKILSTPNMVALMEAAALELAKAYLDEGMTTVGAEIHCRHLAPTPVGMKVTATARLRSIERRKMWFDIEVHDEKGKCGEGSHLRIMVAPKGIHFADPQAAIGGHKTEKGDDDHGKAHSVRTDLGSDR